MNEEIRFDTPIKPGYYICDLMRECIDEFYDVCAHLLDPPDGMPDKFVDIPLTFIHKEFLRAFKRLRKCNKSFNRIKAPSRKNFLSFLEQNRTVTAKPVDEPSALPVEVSSKEIDTNVK